MTIGSREDDVIFGREDWREDKLKNGHFTREFLDKLRSLRIDCVLLHDTLENALLTSGICKKYTNGYLNGYTNGYYNVDDGYRRALSTYNFKDEFRRKYQDILEETRRRLQESREIRERQNRTRSYENLYERRYESETPPRSLTPPSPKYSHDSPIVSPPKRYRSTGSLRTWNQSFRKPPVDSIARKTTISRQAKTKPEPIKPKTPWYPRITIPEPFQMTIRERLAPKKARYAEKFLKQILAEKESKEKQETEQLKIKFRANPVPPTTYRSDANFYALKRSKSMAFLRAEKEAELKRSESQPELSGQPFRAHPVPITTYIRPSTITNDIREARREQRAIDLLRSSWAPRGLDDHSVRSHVVYQVRHVPKCFPEEPSFHPHISKSVPDFRLLHKKWEDRLSHTVHRPTTVVFPFHFHETYHKHHCRNIDEYRPYYRQAKNARTTTVKYGLNTGSFPKERMDWSCKYCTFINKQRHPLCQACGAESPYSRSHEKRSILPKIKLPSSVSSTINSAVATIDNAIGALSDELRSMSISSPTTTFYPPPRPSASRTVLTELNDWTCPRCTTKNLSSQKFCVSCNFSKFDDPKLNYWTCTKCYLSQPLPPINSKCPLCREKVPKLIRKNLTASLPQLHNLTPVQNSTLIAQSSQENDEETKAIYDNIVQFCKQYKQSFIDDGFPHSHRSIGDLASLEKNMKIVWLRPQQIYTKDGFHFKWTVFNNPQPTDIEQGVLGNCWFISALAVIAERPEILEKIVLTKLYNQHGVYQIRLCVDGLWQTVVVDDFFPCDSRSKALAFAVGRKNQLWVPLIEKALAKIYGNYIALRAGRSVEGLATLTGAPCQHIDLEVEDPAQLDLIWVQLLSAHEANFLMGCSCGAGRRPINDVEFKKLGLMSCHAYSLLDVRQVENYRLVRLRNPWGGFVWAGEWGANDPRSGMLTASYGGNMAGTFWMPFDKFVKYFDSVDIAQLRLNPEWHTKRYSLDLGWDESSAKIIKFSVTKPTEMCFTLFQRGARTVLDLCDIMLLVHREDPSTCAPGELIIRTPRRCAPSVRTEDIFLQPGKYVICAVSFAHFADFKQLPATVVIHSAKTIFSEMTSAPLDYLSQSIIALMLKEGNAKDQVPGEIARFLSHEIGGLIVMIDNLNTDKCVQVKADCQNSINILSSRCELTTIDSIPPLHRQILLVLTHFEPSQMYIVEHHLTQRLYPRAQLADFAPQSPYAQNIPDLSSHQCICLHAPKPLYS